MLVSFEGIIAAKFELKDKDLNLNREVDFSGTVTQSQLDPSVSYCYEL